MNTLLDYAGKRAVVVGCATGIGRAVAERLLDLGAEVHGLDISATDLRLNAFTRLDLNDPDAVEAAAAGVEGPVDALFNCAGIPPGPDGLTVIRVNFIGIRRLTDLLLPRMARGGAVASISSNGGARWAQNLPALLDFLKADTYEAMSQWCQAHSELTANGYGFSKEALIAWTLQSAEPFIARGVRINCTSPGAVQTPMLEAIEKMIPADRIDIVAQPIGRRSTPDEQAWPLLMLNSPASAYVNGAVLWVDGGFLARSTVAAAAASA